MDSLRTEALTDALRSDLDDGLRTVAVGNAPGREHEISYVRADVDELYTDETREYIFEEIVSNTSRRLARRTSSRRSDGSNTRFGFRRGIDLVGRTDELVLFVGLDDDESLILPAVAACREQL